MVRDNCFVSKKQNFWLTLQTCKPIYLLIYFCLFTVKHSWLILFFSSLGAGPAPRGRRGQEEGEEFLTGWPGSSGALPPSSSQWELPPVDDGGHAGGQRSGGLQGLKDPEAVSQRSNTAAVDKFDSGASTNQRGKSGGLGCLL